MSPYSREQQLDICRVWFGPPEHAPDLLPRHCYYILDTCVLLHHITVVLNAIKSAFACKARKVFILPIIVRLELERQAMHGRPENCESYKYWFRHKDYLVSHRKVKVQATYVLAQLNRLVMQKVTTFRYQHETEVTNLKALINDDLILDCTLYFKRHVDKMVEGCHVLLVSNDSGLCRKVLTLNCHYLHHDDWATWFVLLFNCEIPDIKEVYLDKLPIPYPEIWSNKPELFSAEELKKREEKFQSYIALEQYIDVDRLQAIDLKSDNPAFNERFHEEVDVRELPKRRRYSRLIEWLKKPKIDSHLCYLQEALDMSLMVDNE